MATQDMWLYHSRKHKNAKVSSSGNEGPDKQNLLEFNSDGLAQMDGYSVSNNLLKVLDQQFTPISGVHDGVESLDEGVATTYDWIGTVTITNHASLACEIYLCDGDASNRVWGPFDLYPGVIRQIWFPEYWITENGCFLEVVAGTYGTGTVHGWVNGGA